MLLLNLTKIIFDGQAGLNLVDRREVKGEKVKLIPKLASFPPVHQTFSCMIINPNYNI